MLIILDKKVGVFNVLLIATTESIKFDSRAVKLGSGSIPIESSLKNTPKSSATINVSNDEQQNQKQSIGSTVNSLEPSTPHTSPSATTVTESQSLIQNDDDTDNQIEKVSRISPLLSSKYSAMPPKPQDSTQTELAPRKRRRKRDDPRNCLTNSEEFDSDDASPLSCSDVESFQGKIVYNPDGSAFIIDSENESLSNISSADNCTSDGVHLPATPNNPKIHSFRVVSAIDAQCLLPSSVNTNSRVTSLNSGSSASNNLDTKSSAAKITKPILMCFICKLSFGNTKPKVTSEVSTETTEEKDTESFAELKISEKPQNEPTPLQSAAVAAPTSFVSQPTQPQPVQQPIQYTPPQYVARESGQQIQQENIRNQLQEIVSDINRAVEENQLFYQPPTLRSTVTSQNTTTTEYNRSILQQPTYLYQEDTSTTTSSLSKPIDLQKIFTPANDAEEIVPHKNRRNENATINGFDYQRPQQYSEEKSYSTQRYESKIPLKLVMDPRGVVQDVTTQGITYDHSSGMLSPDKCAELVSALHTDAPKGKGAELFAKRRKRSEKWIVDETTRSASNPVPTSYSAGPTPLYDTNQFNQPSYADKPAYQPAPWQVSQEPPRRDDYFRESAYQPAPPSHNFAQPAPPSAYHQPAPAPIKSYSLPKNTALPLTRISNSQRDLAYKPSIPQGWNAPPANLPNEMFTPPEIPLSGYTPPQTDIYLPKTSAPPSSYYPHQYEDKYAPIDSYRSPAAQPVPSCKNLHHSQVYTQQDQVPNFKIKPFTPSPISQEKLAPFEQNAPPYQPPVIRRPLTIPNQAVKNASSTPFGGFRSSYDSSSYQNSTWQQTNDYSQSNRSFSSSTANYPSQAPLAAQKSSRIPDLAHQENYNRAARGWGQSKNYYQPISFTKPHQIELPYTDF